MEITSTQQFTPSWTATWDPIRAMLIDVWNQWYKNPTVANSTAMLRILALDGADLQAMAAGKPLPVGFPPNTKFIHYYTQGMSLLTSWIDGGCKPSGIDQVSEFINSIVIWTGEPRTSSTT